MNVPPELLIGCGLIICYCLPSIVAFVRQHSATSWICVINLCLGWTVLGWFAALFWSMTTHHRYRFRFKTAARPSIGRSMTKPADSITYPLGAERPSDAFLRGGPAHSGTY